MLQTTNKISLANKIDNCSATPSFSYRNSLLLLNYYFETVEDGSKVEEERRKYQQLVQGMLKEKNAMKGQIEWRVVYGGEDFVKDMATSYNITEKIKRMGR